MKKAELKCKIVGGTYMLKVLWQHLIKYYSPTANYTMNLTRPWTFPTGFSSDVRQRNMDKIFKILREKEGSDTTDVINDEL